MVTPEELAEWGKDVERGAFGNAASHRIGALLDAVESTAATALMIDQERMAAEARAHDLEIERNLLRTTLAETLAMLQELDAAWNKDGAVGMACTCPPLGPTATDCPVCGDTHADGTEATS